MASRFLGLGLFIILVGGAAGYAGIEAPVPLIPLQGQTLTQHEMTFEWSPVPGAVRYQLTLRKTPGVSQKDRLILQIETSDTTVTVSTVFPFVDVLGLDLWWAVRAQDSQGQWGPWSDMRSFLFCLGGACAGGSATRLPPEGLTLSGGEGDILIYEVPVPPDQGLMLLRTRGGRGVCSMVVKGPHTPWGFWDGISNTPGTDQVLSVGYPGPGAWMLVVYGERPFSDVELSVEFLAAPKTLAWTSDVGLFADFRAANVLTRGIDVELGPFICYEWVGAGNRTQHHMLNAPGRSFIRCSFSLTDPPRDVCLTLRHLTSSGTPEGSDRNLGYSPIDIVVNDTDADPFNNTDLLVDQESGQGIDDFDVATHHGYRYGLETDTFTIPSGQLHVGENTITIAAVDDPCRYETKYWIQALRVYPKGTARFQFASGAYTVDEAGCDVLVRVLRMEDSVGRASVRYSVCPSTATEGLDFDIQSGTLDFEDGQESALIPVHIVDDDLAERPETFTLSLSEPSSDNLIGTPGVAQVTIVDSESPLQVVYVDARAPAQGDGRSWSTAFCDLQNGIRQASILDSNDVEVWVAQGTYRPDRGTADRAMSFCLANGVALYGGFSGKETQRWQRDPDRFETMLSGDLRGDDRPQFGNTEDNSYHVVTATSVNAVAVLDGFTITGGRTDSGYTGERTQGGGLSCVHASPTIRNCHITSNWGGEGAGVYAGYFSYPTFERCRFTSNLAEYPNAGGGGMTSLMSSPLLINCILTGNRARTRGGGLYSWDSSPVLIHCTVMANSMLKAASASGGNLCILRGVYPTCPVLIDSVVALGGGERGPEAYIEGDARMVLDHCYIDGGWDQLTADPYHAARVERRQGNLTGAEVRAFPLTPDGHLRAGAALIGTGLPIPGVLNDIDGDPRGSQRVDIGADQFVDEDTDGLPDWWEARRLGSPTAASPDADPDADGLSNRDEYELYSSHPTRLPVCVDPIVGDDSYAGTSAAPKRTVQAALGVALDGDTVRLVPGTYAGLGNRDLDAAGRAVVIRGDGAGTTTLDCEYAGFAVRYDEGEMAGAALVGLTITHAQSDAGGAVQCDGSGPQIRDCHLVDNAPILDRLRRTTTLEEGDSFDFLTEVRGRLDGGDLYLWRGEFRVDRPGQGGILDMGPIQMIQVREVGEDVYGSVGVKVTQGHTYVLRLSNATVFAVLLEVRDVQADQVTFDWVVVKEAFQWPRGYLGGAIGAHLSLLTLADCQISNNGSYGLFTQGGSVQVVGDVELAANDWLGRSLLLTGSGTLRVAPDTALAIDDSIVRCNVRGPGRIQVSLGKSLTAEGQAVIDLEGGSIQCDGLLHAKDRATISHTDIRVARASFENQAVISNNVITAEAGEPFGQFFVEDSVTITDNFIAADGDRYMDLNPSELDPTATLLNNRIDVTVTEGVATERGGLFEVRGRDGLASPIASPGAGGLLQQVARVPAFAVGSWTLDRLELIEGAKLNLTNRFDFGNGGPSEVLYVRDLVLRPGAVLNLGYNRLYYEHLMGDPNAVISIPILGFSLSMISFEDQDEFAARISTTGSLEHVRRLPAEAVANLIGDPPASGVMEMRNLLGLHPDNVFTARAKGLFAKANEETIVVRFEYLFESASGELAVYLTDTPEFLAPDHPDRPRHYVLAGRVASPPPGRPGAMASGAFGVFEQAVRRGALDFARGVRIELELIGPEGTSVLIDNWDPLVQPNPHYCWDLVRPNDTVDAFDFLAVMSETGRRSEAVMSASGTQIGDYLEGFFCRDGYVTSLDAMAANWHACGLGCPLKDPIGSLAANASPPSGTQVRTFSAAAAGGSACGGSVLAITGKGYTAEAGLACDDFLGEGLYGLDSSGAASRCAGSLVSGQLNVRLTSGSDGGLYAVNLERGLVRLADNRTVLSGGLFGVATEPRYGQPADVYVGVQSRSGSAAGLPILDAAFDAAGDLYVVPVVVSPDGNAPYAAAARLSRGPAANDWSLVQVYVPNMQPNDNIHLDGVREVELDGRGRVYVLNVGRQNRSDVVLVFDAASGQELARQELYDLGIESPAGMRVLSEAGGLCVGGIEVGQATACVLILSLEDLGLPAAPHVKSLIEIAGMGQVTDVAADSRSGKVWVTGITLNDVPTAFDTTTLRDILNRPPFYSAYTASFPITQQGPVQATPLTGPGCDLTLPLAVEWMGSNP